MPGGLPSQAFDRPGRDPLGFFGRPPGGPDPGFVRPGRLEACPCRIDPFSGCLCGCLLARSVPLEPGDVGRQSSQLGLPLEAAIGSSEGHRRRGQEGRAVTNDDLPAWREDRLQLEGRIEVGRPGRPFEEGPGGAQLVSPDRLDQEPSAEAGQPVAERLGAPRGGGCGRTVAFEDEPAALGGKLRNRRSPDQVPLGGLSQGDLDRGSKCGIDLQAAVDAATTDAPGGLGNPAGLLFGLAGLGTDQAAADCRERRAGGGRSFSGGASGTVGGVGRNSGRVDRGCRIELRLNGRPVGLPGRFEGRLCRYPLGGRSRGPGAIIGRPPLGIGQLAASRFELGGTGGKGPLEGGPLVALGLAGRLQGAELTAGIGQGELGFLEGGLEGPIALGRRDGQGAPASRQLRLRCRSLLLQPAPITTNRLELGRLAGGGQLQPGQGGSRRFEGLPALDLDGRPSSQPSADLGQHGLGLGQGQQRSLAFLPGPIEASRGLGGLTGSAVPASVRARHQPSGQLVAGVRPAGLLLGLGGQPAGLRPELAQDVLDAGQVGLGLGQLLLGPAAAALMAANPGDLLEQRPAFLWPEGQRLVDHALADEQEGVVGEVGRVEQLDQVPQPDPTAIQQVVVLARPIQPPAELQDLVVDRQQAVGVVEDEADVGHAQGRSLVRAGEDDVLGLAAAQGPALLPERPAQAVGEVALARAVRSDDGADARPELD